MYKIGAIILAAGVSKRMGKPKLLLPFNELPLIYYPVSLAVQNELKPIVLVTGQYMNDLENTLGQFNKQVTFAYNDKTDTGISSSLKIGINTVKSHVDAVLVFLGDQPFVPTEVVHKIIQEYHISQHKGIRIIRPRYGGQEGHPILFDSCLFHEFQLLQGDIGGKEIIKANKKYVKLIDFPNKVWGTDIDTPEEYDALIKGV
ncbi:nucleotidyltransferase family protein [Lysinibacillus telephonicus]|uniref:nucleotidyltransferase family protein n=1 Tax=Lysinibacillus telephonicus TaxID=1714840 RepID=UPI00397BE6A9